MLTFDEIRHNADINTYITAADHSLAALGFTEHSFAHVGKVANTAAYILSNDINIVNIINSIQIIFIHFSIYFTSSFDCHPRFYLWA